VHRRGQPVTKSCHDVAVSTEDQVRGGCAAM
jgi:hypothetical protein